MSLLLALILALIALFLFPSAWQFPMDDTYIHFVYAQNLAETGRLFFNQPGETGVGSTSLLWAVLLAAAHRVGVPLHLAAKALGASALIGCAWAIERLMRPALGPRWALAAAALAAASGHLLWFALSGMETVLFLFLGLLALLLHRAGRWALLGITLGLLALARPEGLALAAAIGLAELWQRRQDWKSPRALVRAMPGGLLLAAGLCLLLCGPWFLYLLDRTGAILPTSAIGKQTSSLLGIRLIVSRSPALAFLANLTPVIYLGTWIIYLLTFTLGGIALPGPSLPIGAEVGNANYAIAYLGIAGWLLVIFPLLFAAFRPTKPGAPAPASLIPTPLFFWLLLHNLAYAVFLPIPGTASRYGPMNHVVLWILLAIGLKTAWSTQKPIRFALAGGLCLIALANTLYWNRVYDANLDHMQNVRMAAAQFVTESIPAGEKIAAFDIGVLRYQTGRPLLDLGGLVDPALGAVYRTDGRIDRYLYEQGARWVLLPGRTGTLEEGWFDFAREMGLTASPYFTIETVRVLEIPYERWLLGYLPTNNYQATVSVYRLTPGHTE